MVRCSVRPAPIARRVNGVTSGGLSVKFVVSTSRVSPCLWPRELYRRTTDAVWERVPPVDRARCAHHLAADYDLVLRRVVRLSGYRDGRRAGVEAEQTTVGEPAIRRAE